MRFMMIVKANKDSESGVLPGEELMSAMMDYNQKLIDSGAWIDGNGLQASSKGARVTFSGTDRTVTQGPFSNPTELIAGYWIVQFPSLADAIELAKRVPFYPGPGEEKAVVEIRQVFEMDDFPPSEAVARAKEMAKETSAGL